MNRITHASLYSIIDCTTTDTKNITYGYGANGNISSVKYVGYLTDYTYDTFNRLNNRKVGVGYTTIVNENYVYKTYEQDEQTYTTKTLAVIDDQTSANRDRTATYDSNGYITEISYNGENYYYDYDGAGRIKTESYNNQIINYTYDAYNNVQKTGLTYTNGILTSANGATISYDDMGNPTTYKGNTFTWEQGRKLVAGSMNGKTFTYAYDGNGMRFEKVVNGVKTNYYYDGSQLLMESTNNKRIWYIYGVTGIEGLIVENNLGDNHYYFDKNTLGDIVAIRDEDGYIVATYSYDAWGNAKVMNANGTENTSSTFIGNINPYRYRGYYYDKETGFYYLQTRYYDPTICRFINADNYELIAELSTVIGQLNLYAYANNNPIMLTDESGEGIFFVLFLAAFTVVGAGVGLGVGVSQGHEGWQLVGDVALGAFIGLMTGGLVASTWGAMGMVFNWGSVLGITAKRAFALGAAIYDFTGIIISSIKRVKFQPIEMNPTTHKHNPQIEPPAIIRPYSFYVVGGEL